MKHKTYFAGLTACVAALLFFAAAPAASYQDKLDDALFRAGEKADITKAKAIVDAYRKQGWFGLDAQTLDTVDACYAAGAPDITVKERENILQDGHIKEFYTPNDNMAFAEGFANGWGVKKDLKRAIAFACRANTVPMQLILQMQALKANRFDVNAPFLFCRLVTSNDDIGQCAAYTEDRAEQYRRLERYRMAEDLNDPQRDALHKLNYLSEMFFAAHAKYEIGESDKPRLLLTSETLENKREIFRNQIKLLELHLFPETRKGGYNPVRDDKDLNALYRRILLHPWPAPEDHPGAVTENGLRKTQRAWIAYRDAWVNYANARWPGVDTNAIRAILIETRIKDLKTAYDVD